MAMAMDMKTSDQSNLSFIEYNYDLKISAMTSDKIDFILPATFSIGPDPNCLSTNFREALSRENIYELVESIIKVETRLLAKSMTMEEIFFTGYKWFDLNLVCTLELVLLKKWGMSIRSHSLDIEEMRRLEEQENVIRNRNRNRKRRTRDYEKDDYVYEEDEKKSRDVIKQKKKKKCEKKVIRVANDGQSPTMPSEMVAKIQTLGGNEIEWVDEKLITNTDANVNQARLYLPVPEVLEPFLTEEETKFLKKARQNAIHVPVVIDNVDRTWTMALKYWSTASKYVFSKPWSDFLKEYKIEGKELEGDKYVVEIWKFRITLPQEPVEGEKGNLGFALNFRAI